MIPESNHGQHHHSGEWNILPHRYRKDRIEGKREEEPQEAKRPARRSVAAEQVQHRHIRCREQRHRDKRIKCHAIIHEDWIPGDAISGSGPCPIQRGLIRQMGEQPSACEIMQRACCCAADPVTQLNHQGMEKGMLVLIIGQMHRLPELPDGIRRGYARPERKENTAETVQIPVPRESIPSSDCSACFAASAACLFPSSVSPLSAYYVDGIVAPARNTVKSMKIHILMRIE